jgi:SAM-dependent methyltransferase
MPGVLYALLVFLELLFAFFVFAYALSALYSNFMGSAYVPTKNKELEKILKACRLRKNQLFIDLGCGDGRVVRAAVSKYQVRGVGIDINPVLIFLTKIKARFAGLKNIKFFTQNVFVADITDADIVYIFLMPRLIEKLVPKLKRETKPSALIVSHGFKIPDFEKFRIKTINGAPFSTFFYKIRK